jgi:dTDP-glucose 4,6-dehydratase
LTLTLLDLLGKPRSLIRHVQDRPGHDRRYAIDCTKIERELGWRPRIAFAEGLQDTIAWYLANPEWVAGVRSGAYLEYRARQYGEGGAAA